jgi:hypothetical protein
LNQAGKELALLNRVFSYLHQHALAAAAFACSILALAGSSYAAFRISGAQIRNHTINPVKLNPKFINGNVRAWAIVSPDGRVIAGKGKPKVTVTLVAPGNYGIKWGVKVRRCATEVTIDGALSAPTERLPLPGSPSQPFTAGYAVAATSKIHNGTGVQTYNQDGQPAPLGFDLTVVC